jgi:hypothetical protein
MNATKNIIELRTRVKLQKRIEEARQLLETARHSSVSGWTVAYFERQYQSAFEAYKRHVTNFERTGR